MFSGLRSRSTISFSCRCWTATPAHYGAVVLVLLAGPVDLSPQMTDSDPDACIPVSREPATVDRSVLVLRHLVGDADRSCYQRYRWGRCRFPVCSSQSKIIKACSGQGATYQGSVHSGNSTLTEAFFSGGRNTLG